MWKHLCRRQLGGYKFRRQHSILGYIADFYCAECKLVVELDGKYHDTEEAQRYDAERNRNMEAQGIVVLRFENPEIFKDREVVLEKILAPLKSIKPEPAPSKRNPPR